MNVYLVLDPTGKYFDDLNEAFYGGHVDMYVPKNIEGTKVYHYDINSLYPYAMKTFKYPTNFVAYFKGDVSNMPEYNKMYKDCVGFYKVKVTSPKDITHPLLPVKINNSSVYAEGTWTGWYYSEELNNAVKYGYSYEILEGYLFNSDEIFAGYVDRMYKMKEESQKDSPGYVISKLLMNSLYGRFGMKRSMVNHEIVKQKKC
uniref:DNA-directed DNA polymerase n=1 Tax=Porodaedalea pini TaxID=108901 RepID=A0A5B9RK26_9AGAM|nr:DNA polymerase family B [Porodaedalea pini]QEG57037.1 DNA polymerase family B [Porodaedalea pini]